MDSAPKVTVIITVYNSEEYLPSCLASVLEQSLNNIEIICVDDCSSDNSLNILNNYANNDKRILVFKNNINKGAPLTRNIGIENSQGEYIYFLDSDDILFSKDSLEYLYQIACEENSDEVIGVILRWDEVTEERKLGYHKAYLTQKLSRAKFEGNENLHENVCIANKLVRRSLIFDHKLRFNPQLKKFDDNPFSWKVHLFANSISLTLKATYLHRQKATTSVHKSLMQQKQLDYYYHSIAALEMLMFFDEHKEFEKSRLHFDHHFYNWMETDVAEISTDHISLDMKTKILNAYKPVLNRIPHTSYGALPYNAREIISLINTNNIENAWHKLTNQRCVCSDSRQQQQTIENLERKLDSICNSYSWRLTKPLRTVKRLLQRTKN